MNISGAFNAFLLEFGALYGHVAPKLTWRNILHVSSLLLLVIFDFRILDFVQLRGYDGLNSLST
jgi:hypothetical protein